MMLAQPADGLVEPPLVGMRETMKPVVVGDRRSERPEALGHAIKNRAREARRHVLGQVGGMGTRSQDDRARFRTELSGDQPQERGLADAVASQQAEPLSGLDVDRD